MAVIPNVVDDQPIDTAWGNAVADAVNANTTARTPGAWTALTLTNGWQSYGSGYQVAQYRKVGDMVQVRGLVKNTGISPPSTLAVLPTGHRPPANLQFAQEGSGAHAFVEASSGGNLNFMGPAPGQTALNINFQFSVTA